MDFAIYPLYKSIFTRRESLEAQQRAEYEAREADRLHRERIRELKYKKVTECSIWIPSRLRLHKRSNKSNDA
ncbi:hypothetical protein GGF37_005506, partial [Kickxella alabastrina]